MDIACTYCSAVALHTLYPDMDKRTMVARVADFPKASREYCLLCITSLCAGEEGADLSRRLNSEHGA